MAAQLCPVVIGRARELDLLAVALADAAAGHGSVVFLLGEAGIGKSRLAREVVAAATAGGARVLQGRAVPAGTPSAFRPLTEALAAAIHADDVAAITEMRPWLPALAVLLPGLPATERSAADDSPAARGEAVVRLLRHLTPPAGGVLVLEDLHWADPETLAIVEHLVDNLHRAAVLCIGTVRSDEPSAARDLARAVHARRGATVLELTRLNDAQAAAMVHACTGGADSGRARRVIDVAEGIPLLVEEVLATPGVPTSFADGVRRRLDSLAADELLVLHAAALLGRQFDWQLLAATTGLVDARVADALERAVAVQLLSTSGAHFQFRHALTRDAVLETVLPPRRRALASAALRAIEDAHHDLSADLRDVAAELAEHAGEPGRAGVLRLESGRAALRKGALQSAVGSLQRAMGLLAEGTQRDGAGQLLIEALTQAGRVDEAMANGAELLPRLAPAAAAAVHLQLAAAAIAASRWAAADAALATGRAAAHTAASAPLLAAVAVRAAELAISTGDVGAARQLADQALDAARSVGLPAVECEALQLIGRCERFTSLERASAAFVEAVGVATAHELALWRVRALHELGTIAMLDQGDCAGLLAARIAAEAAGALATTAVLDLQLLAGYEISHDLEAARRHGDLAIARATELGLDGVLAGSLQLLATLEILVGRPEHARTAAAAARAVDPANREIEAQVLLGTDGLHALLEEDRAAAIAALEAGEEMLHQLGQGPPSEFRGLLPILLALDLPDRAPDAIANLERRGALVLRANRGYAAYARAVIVGRRDRSEAASLVAQGDRDLAHGPFWHQLGRRLVAEAAVDDGWGDPGSWLREAAAWFTAEGFRPLAAGCGDLLRGRRAVPSAWRRAGISPREADVLQLLIEGRSNKQIADALFISPRTIEKHVENMLRKTSASSRTQLALVAAQALAGSAPASPTT